jgi:predicted transcriptional regulator
MTAPDGSLTPAQYEILQMLWDAPDGLTVAEIWERICQDREVSRTTVLNLVDRLEKRNWLRREKVDGVFRYMPAVDRQSTQSLLASEFVGEFFDGSPTSFVLSLLGSNRISKAELQRLKSLLDDPKQNNPRKKGQ